MKVLELRQGLELYSQTLELWGGKASEVSDFRKFLQLLGEHDDLTVTALCVKFSERQVALKEAASSSRAAKTKLNTELVDAYVARFNAANETRMDQLGVVDELKNDKIAKLAELNAITEAMTQAGVAYSKKPQALEALRNWVNRRFDTDRRLKGTSGIF